MKRVLLWTLVAAGVMVLLFLAAVLVVSRVIDPNDYKPQLEKLVAEKTGRTLRVGGEVRLSLFPWIGVSFSDLALGNPAGFPDPGFLQMKAFEVRLKLWPLLFREVQVGRLVIEEPQLALVTLADGRVNWEFRRQGAAPAPAAKETASDAAFPLRSLTAEEIRIRNGTIRLVDQRTKTERTIRRLDLSILDVAAEKPLRLSLSADWEGKPLALEGRLGPLGDLSRPGALPLELRLAALGRLNASVRGRIEEPLQAPRAALSLEIAEFSARGLLSELKLAAPATRDPRVLEKVALKTDLQADAASVTLSGGQLVLDDTQAAFEARVSEFGKPRIEARLNLDALDLDRYLPPKAPASGQGAPGPPPPAGTSSGPEPPPDFKALRRLMLEATVEIGRLTVAGARLETLQARIRARDGVLTVDPFSLAAYEGRVSGRTAADVTGEIPRIEARFEASGLRMLPLLKDTAGKDFLEGTAQAEAALTMQGVDAARIKQSLGGSGRLRVEDGAIVGVDIADVARSAKAFFAGGAASGPKPRTDFAELTVPFTIEKGLFQTTQTEMKSPLFRLQAAGRADLVRESLDFRLEPKIVGTLKGQGDQKERSGLAVPILVSGTFDNPQFRPDLKSLVGEGIRKALDPPASGDPTPLQEKGRDLLRKLSPTRP